MNQTKYGAPLKQWTCTRVGSGAACAALKISLWQTGETMTDPNQGGSRRDPIEDLQARIDAALDEARPKIRKAFEELETRIDASLMDIQPKIDNARREVQPRIDQFMADLQPRLDTLLRKVQEKLESLRADLDARRVERTGRTPGMMARSDVR